MKEVWWVLLWAFHGYCVNMIIHRICEASYLVHHLEIFTLNSSTWKQDPFHRVITMSPFCSALCLAYCHFSWCAALSSSYPSSLFFLIPYLPYGDLGKCSSKASPSQILLPIRALPYLSSLHPSPAFWQHCLATQLGHRWWLPWWWRFSHQKGI